MVTLLQRGATALVFAVLVAGCSSDEPSDQAAAPATTAATESAPPTADNVKLAVFERAFSECATYGVARLSGKYKVAVKTRGNVATAVARGWTKFFRAGADAIPDGRAGCLQGFTRK